jgi:hypothetical protein
LTRKLSVSLKGFSCAASVTTMKLVPMVSTSSNYADVLGATMLSESMSEYVSLKF